jgi:hypothetical protein
MRLASEAKIFQIFRFEITTAKNLKHNKKSLGDVSNERKNNATSLAPRHLA